MTLLIPIFLLFTIAGFAQIGSVLKFPVPSTKETIQADVGFTEVIIIIA